MVISMQRREFVRSALFGTGAALSLALPAAVAALDTRRNVPLRASLARLETHGDNARWQPIERCSAGECVPGRLARVELTALGFPQHFQSLSIEAMFATTEGLRPFRIAHYEPGAVSPASKPFSFDVDAAALVGFRVGHASPRSAQAQVAGSAFPGKDRMALVAGHYVLAASLGQDAPDFGSLEVPAETSLPMQTRDGRAVRFAWLRFSVHPLDA